MTPLTSAQKMTKRRAALEQAARAAGWNSWSEFETAIKNAQIAIPVKAK